MNVSSSRIQACFSRTRISAQESELPICPAFALLYMAKKRFFTEKARSSSRTCSAERSARLDRVERLSVTGSSLSYASPARRVPRERRRRETHRGKRFMNKIDPPRQLVPRTYAKNTCRTPWLRSGRLCHGNWRLHEQSGRRHRRCAGLRRVHLH